VFIQEVTEPCTLIIPRLGTKSRLTSVPYLPVRQGAATWVSSKPSGPGQHFLGLPEWGTQCPVPLLWIMTEGRHKARRSREAERDLQDTC
jgi:hypothetical protein